jgi:hypothetical protein
MRMEKGRPMINGRKRTQRPAILWILIILLLFIGAGALISGTMLFLSPDGALMGMPTDLLEGTPFSSYLVPGIILFTFVGVFSVFAGYSLLKKPDWHWPALLNPCKSYHWAWTTAWAEGVIMLIWIGIETILLGYISFLQPLIAGWGIVTIGLTLLPPIRRYYKEGNHNRA